VVHAPAGEDLHGTAVHADGDRHLEDARRPAQEPVDVGVEAAQGGGVVEARFRRAAGEAWRPGTRGEASVELRRSNLIGALWWNARQLLRGDLLL
jgi:hypothetical protein